MPHAIETELIERVTPIVARARHLPRARARPSRYADLRLDVSEGKFAAAENGAPQGLGRRLRARLRHPRPRRRSDGRARLLRARPRRGRPRRTSSGSSTTGSTPPTAAPWPTPSGRREARDKFGGLGESLADTRLLPDPRGAGGRARRLRDRPARDEPRRDGPVHAPTSRAGSPPSHAHRRLQLHVDHDPAQPRAVRLLRGRAHRPVLRPHPGHVLRRGHGRAATARSSTTCSATSAAGRSSPRRRRAAACRSRPSPTFALALARDARGARRRRRRCPRSNGEVTVVTDPHYNTLVSHEIVGHPVELDRALKMETAYAGRSWLLRGLDDTQVGQRIASPLVTAYSDPVAARLRPLRVRPRGHAGPARGPHRPRHLHGFMNSRQTAAIFGGEPNGHWKATEAPLVPLIRMSSTVFAAGDRDPRRHHRARSTTATTSSATRFRPSPRAGRTSASPRARSTRSATAVSAGSTATAASWPTPATT